MRNAGRSVDDGDLTMPDPAAKRVPLGEPVALAVWRCAVELTVAQSDPPARRQSALLRTVARSGGTTLGDLLDVLTAEVREPTALAQAHAWVQRSALDPTGALTAAGIPVSWEYLIDADPSVLGHPQQIDSALRDAFRSAKDIVAGASSVRELMWTLDFTDPAAGLGAAISDGIAKWQRGGILLPGSSGSGGRLGYRDYLVQTWVTCLATRSAYHWGNPGTATPDDARAQLRSRFSQDFTTLAVAEVAANELLIPIVIEILTRPKPPAQVGCGVSPQAIPARGAMSARAYLDTLLALSGVTPAEFALRYRVDVSRPDTVMSSGVEENIATLLGFFRDSFQSVLDPAPASPDIWKQPIIDSLTEGAPPFFLEYGEWEDASAPFFPENFLSLRRVTAVTERPGEATLALEPKRAWYDKTFTAMDKVLEAHVHFDRGEYELARRAYQAARQIALLQVQDTVLTGYDWRGILSLRRRMKITLKSELRTFELAVQPGDMSINTTPLVVKWQDRTRMWLVLFSGYAYYQWMGDCLAALGRLAEATRHYGVLAEGTVGSASFDDPAGPFDWWHDGEPNLYTAGDLPYTYLRLDDKQSGYGDPTQPDGVYERPWYGFLGAPTIWFDLAPKRFTPLLHRVERRRIALQFADAIVEWADALFRSDDASNAARARELYKAVLWVHGDDPGISPTWERELLRPQRWPLRRNPAVVSQTQRARAGLYKFEHGLNWFGYTDAHVPTLRYRALKDAADRFCALAKSAQQDFIQAMGALESVTLEDLRLTNMMAKAVSQQKIAAEQISIAKAGVVVAQKQVDAVDEQIAAKRKELDDKDDFFSQLGDFFSGVAKTFTNLPGGAGGAIGSSVASEAGVSSASSAGFMGIGAAATVTAGFAVFAYAGYTSMSAMADSYAGLQKQISQLETVAKPAALLAKGVRESEQRIAEYGASIVAADLEYGRRLVAYQDARLLGADFWTAISAVMRRAMRRYLELGAWAGWLAERALVFEQSRDVHIMRVDYFPRARGGVTGADQLSLDLAELEAARLAGMRGMVPFRHTYSLATDAPQSFGALKTKGLAVFATDEAELRRAYPGTYGHRIDTVSVVVSGPAAVRSIRGVLAHSGVSLVMPEPAGPARPMVAEPTALPLGDAAASTLGGGVPLEQLRAFEGFGLTGLWSVALSTPAGSPAVNGVTDVLVTVEGHAFYGVGVAVPDAPAATHVLLSGAALDPVGFAAWKKDDIASLELRFDLRELLGDPVGDIVNVCVLTPGLAADALTGQASLEATAVSVPFTTASGYAASNGPPLREPGGPVAASTLNPLIGQPVAQPVGLRLETPTRASGRRDRLVDVILAVEYAPAP